MKLPRTEPALWAGAPSIVRKAFSVSADWPGTAEQAFPTGSASRQTGGSDANRFRSPMQ